MKKLFILLVLLIPTSKVYAFDEIETLSEEISHLEKTLNDKKQELKILSKEISFPSTGYEDLEKDITELAYKDFKLTLVRKGIVKDESIEFPIAVWVVSAELTGDERRTLDAVGNVEIQTDTFTDWAEDVGEFYGELDEDNNFTPIDVNYSRHFEKGTKYAYMIYVPIKDENAEYFLTDNLSQDSLKVPMYKK